MRRHLVDERGIALVMALGMLIVISITTIGLLTYSSSGARSVRYGDARQKASLTAEAGLNEAVSVLAQVAAAGGDVRDPSALPVGSDTFEGGNSASWSGTVNGDTWNLTSTSTVKNPSGAAVIHRTASTQFRIGVDGEGSAPAWQYTYADDLATCMTLQNSSVIAAPFYVRGNMCLQNTANPTGAEITVKGHITLQNASKIGSAAAPITALHTTGCSTSSSGPWTLANCSAANNVYATTVDSTFANVAKPTADQAYWYAYSKPGPKNNCTTGSFPGGFDNDSTMNHSRAALHLLPSTGYSCTVTVGSSTVGKLIWTPGTPGTLQVSGVIFFDGDILFSGTEQAIYSGRGTIYTSGTVTFLNSAYLCGATACDANAWDGDGNMLTFVAGSSSAPNSFITQNTAKFQGGVWAQNDVRQQNSSLIEGPTISRQIYIENSAVAQKWPPIDFVSYGAPAPIGSTKLVPVSGTYSD